MAFARRVIAAPQSTPKAAKAASAPNPPFSRASSCPHQRANCGPAVERAAISGLAKGVGARCTVLHRSARRRPRRGRCSVPAEGHGGVLLRPRSCRRSVEGHRGVLVRPPCGLWSVSRARRRARGRAAAHSLRSALCDRRKGWAATREPQGRPLRGDKEETGSGEGGGCCGARVAAEAAAASQGGGRLREKGPLQKSRGGVFNDTALGQCGAKGVWGSTAPAGPPSPRAMPKIATTEGLTSQLLTAAVSLAAATGALWNLLMAATRPEEATSSVAALFLKRPP